MAISLKRQVMWHCCLAFFFYNTKHEGAVEPGSLQVQNQPGKVCVAQHALAILYFSSRVKIAAAAICCPVLGALNVPEKQNKSLL